jgi:hypothetical protein
MSQQRGQGQAKSQTPKAKLQNKTIKSQLSNFDLPP